MNTARKQKPWWHPSRLIDAVLALRQKGWSWVLRFFGKTIHKCLPAPRSFRPRLALEELEPRIVMTVDKAGIAAMEGQAFSGSVAFFSWNNYASSTVTIDWGDNTTSTGTVSPTPEGYVNILASHTYADEGTFTYTLPNPDNVPTQFTAMISDPPVNAMGGQMIGTAAGVNTGPVLLATFTDPP